MRLVALALLLCACAPPPGASDVLEQALDGGCSCGKERWSIKTASDSGAPRISTVAGSTSISWLSSLSAPATLPETARIDPTELTSFQLVDVSLLQYKKEADCDYHLVLGDGTSTLIAEIADPGCVQPQSPLAGAIAQARAQFDGRHGPVPWSYTSSAETVTVTGVGFFDFKHGQTGVAPNGIELHPVTAICFGKGCSPAAPPAPPPSHGCASADAAPWLALLLLRRRRRATA
jgi:hypothetical protein